MTQIPNNAQFRADTTGVPIVEKGSNSTKSRSQFYTMQDIADSVASVVGVSFGTSGQIPYTNAAGDDLAYSANLTWDGTNSRLGVGVTPSARLHVKGSGTTSATTSFLVENSAGADLLKVTDDGALSLLTGRLRLSNQQSSFDTLTGNLGSIYVTDDDASFPFNLVGNLILQSRSNAFRGIGFATGNTASVRMFISGVGNVGIGVDNPTERLDIDGNLKLTGTIASDGGFANEIAVSGVGVPTWLINNTDTSMYDAQTIGRVAWKVNDANAGGVTETGAIEMEFHDNIPGGPSQGTAGEGADLVIKTGLVAVTGAGQVLTEQMRITKNGYVILANVPTSSAGLAAGTLWNNSGVINIV